MEFNAEIIKRHPYATGGAVIVGGLILFMLLSRSQSGSAAVATTSPANNTAATLQYDEQTNALNAGLAQQQMQAQVAVQTAQISADSTNQQTAAALQNDTLNQLTGLAASLYGTQANVQVNATNAAATTAQQANQLVYAENMQGMQDQVLTSQINAAQNEQEANDATSLAGSQITANYQLGVAQLQNDANTVNDITGLTENQQNDSTTLSALNSNNQAAVAVNNSNNSANLAALASNNNLAAYQTATGASVYNNEIDSQTELGQTELGDAYNLASSQQNAVLSVLPTIVSEAGQQKNSALDATDQTGLFATILSGMFSPGVAAAATSASASTAASGNNATTAQIGTITNGITKIGTSIASGLFA